MSHPGCCLGVIHGFIYSNDTQKTLCDAQCETLCLDEVANCTERCRGSKNWITNCDRPLCTGTCFSLLENYKANKEKEVTAPSVNITQNGNQEVELSWNRPRPVQGSSLVSPYHIIYIIERMHPDPQHPNSYTQSNLVWLTDTHYKFQTSMKCNMDMFRVMAINQFGTQGFSPAIQLPGMRPGPVQNIQYTGRGVYYYRNKDKPDESNFMAILKWDPPTGWKESDIDHYVWNPMVTRYCQEIEHDSLPMFMEIKNQTDHILMTISDNSIGCRFQAQVKAVSKCNISGPWTNFTVDLTNCSDIIGYSCSTKPFDPPGLVENVSLSVSHISVDEVRTLFMYPSYQTESNSPLLIYLHVCWSAPSDLGSQGMVDHFIIRSGRAERNLFPIPPAFIEKPAAKEAPNDTIELIFRLPTESIPYTFGIQVVAVGPGQVIKDNEWGLFPMYTMEVRRNDSGIAQFINEGKVLLDMEGIVILYVNNTLPVHFLFDAPMGRMGNTTIDKYAVQWGPLVGPEANHTISIENKTVLSSNQSILSVTLERRVRRYGLKVAYLSYSEEAEDEVDEKFFTFTLPDDETGTDSTEGTPTEISNDGIRSEQLMPAYIVAGLVVIVVVTTGMARYFHNRQVNVKNLERRLLQAGEEVDEEGEHYFVMRAADNGSDADEPLPTVVTDRWELPHSCLKTGRVIGSGAFGQVVKGRVSKSMLQHRGLEIPTFPQSSTGSTHVTVAIKMLQENSEERYTRDFLNEIEMMKALGYHRNIVSILGCCTLRQPFCLIVEHLANGDLLSYLRKIRQQIIQRESMADVDGYINNDMDVFSPQDLLSMSRQIARGMEYLSQKGFVHRDLAARNILVGDDKLVKIADFGLARYIYHDLDKIYVNRRGGKLPLRWMAPESIFDLTFSTASDIWSYGVLLYEIVTLGGAPYPGLSNTDLLAALKDGHRMARPDNCSQEIYDLMLRCWNSFPESRVSFTQLCDIFTSMLEESSELEYFNFKVADMRDYYTINTDDMDTDDLDLIGCHGNQAMADVGLATAAVSSASRTSVDNVITRLPSDNCDVTEIPKHELSDLPMNYSDEAFSHRMLSTPSFHNMLYPRTDSTECISAETSRAPSRKTSTVDRVSSSSDDVFTDCKSCCQVSTAGNHSNGSGLVQCTVCGRLNITLSPSDIHVGERNDSAIGSTASDASDQSHGNKSECSAISEEYMMPDSPMVAMETISLQDTVPVSYGTPMKAKKRDVTPATFVFGESSVALGEKNGVVTSTFMLGNDQLQLSEMVEGVRGKTTNVAMVENPCYISVQETNRDSLDTEWDSSKYYYIVKHKIENMMMYEQISETDNWNIVETRL